MLIRGLKRLNSNIGRIRCRHKQCWHRIDRNTEFYCWRCTKFSMSSVYGVQRVMRATLPHLRKQAQRNAVIHISSGIGRLAFRFTNLLCFEICVEAIAESYRAELASFGVESCIIEPGAMPTEFLDVMSKCSQGWRKKQSYGDMIHIPQAGMKDFSKYCKQFPISIRRVADAIVDLLVMPFGKNRSERWLITLSWKNLLKHTTNYCMTHHSATLCC